MQPPATTAQPAIVRSSVFGRRDFWLGLAVAILLLGSAMIWFGLDWYARSMWAAEKARLASRAETKWQHFSWGRSPLVTQSRTGMMYAVFPRRLRQVLKERDLFQEMPVINPTVALISRDEAGTSFGYIFSSMSIKALARAVREGAFEPEDLPLLAALPREINELRKMKLMFPLEQIETLVSSADNRLNGESQSDHWRKMREQFPEANPIIRYGPKSTYCLLITEFIHDLESRADILEPKPGPRKLSLPKPLTGDPLRLIPDKGRILAGEMDCIAGALISNMQRLIIAFAQYRTAHGRNPKNVSELLEDEGVRGKLIAVEGAELDYVLDPKSGKVTLRYSLSPALCEMAHQCESNFDESWDASKDISVVSAILYDPRDAPRIMPKEER